MLGFTACRWLISGATEMERQYDLQSLKNELNFPVVGCTVVCACAAWATFAPAATSRFARSLVVVFLFSVPLWYILMSMELTPRRLKGMDQPEFYLSELIVLVAPPLAAAVLLTLTQRCAPGATGGLPASEETEKAD